MKRQRVVANNHVTGEAIIVYEDCGPGRAVPGHGRGLDAIVVMGHKGKDNSNTERSGGGRVARTPVSADGQRHS